MKPKHKTLLLGILLIAAVAVAWSLISGRDIESPHATTSTWQPYDGMSPAEPKAPDYFAIPFMPVQEVPAPGAMALAAEGSAASIYYSDEDAAPRSACLACPSQ